MQGESGQKQFHFMLTLHSGLPDAAMDAAMAGKYLRTKCLGIISYPIGKPGS
jgi:hypothetical protein